MPRLKRSRTVEPSDVFTSDVARGELFRERPKSGANGGEDLVGILARHLVDKTHQVALVGETGVGKSSLLDHVARQKRLRLATFLCKSDSNTEQLMAFFRPENAASRSTTYGAAIPGSLPLTAGSTVSREFRQRQFAAELHESMRSSRTQIDVLALENFHKVAGSDFQTSIIEAMEHFAITGGPKIVVLGIADEIGAILGDLDPGEDRHIRGIFVPRMDDLEIESIFEFGFSRLGFEVPQTILYEMTQVADGYPFLAHELGLRASQICRAGNQRIDEHSFSAALEDLSNGHLSAEFARYRKALESEGPPRERKRLLLMLARDVARRKWTARQVAQMWHDEYPDSNRGHDALSQDMRDLTQGPAVMLAKRREAGEAVYQFARPYTRICLRIVGSRDVDGDWFLQVPF
jgi:hypothetical protein